MISNKYSFKGFKLSLNLLSALKKTIYVLVPAILTELVASNIIATGVAGFLGPAVLNAVEFWFKEMNV
tara:strand:+ start:738 stop:941 length:204 start_codon:yes stop_codon:yes gene_type:complete